MDTLIGKVTLLGVEMGARIFWEYVGSDSNWSDGASRWLEEDEFLSKAGFEIERATIASMVPWLTSAPMCPLGFG
eukprot:165992-Lingulodinium_polyedra.AAC.1